MSVDDGADILQELSALVHDELKVLSYKWVARQHSISANTAKRVLFQLAEQQRDKVRTTYLVSGWTKQEPPSHVHQLVEAGQLQVCRELLGEVTGMHVYSVAPKQETHPDNLWQSTYQQAQQLLKEIMSGEPSASAEVFRNNSCSAVKFIASPLQRQQQQQKSVIPKQPVLAPEIAQPPVQQQQQQAGDPCPYVVPSEAPADSPAKVVSSPKAAELSSPKAAVAVGGKAGVKGAATAAAAAKSNTLANMWSKGPGKAKAAAPAAPTVVTPPIAAPAAEAAPSMPPRQPSTDPVQEEDEDEEAVTMAAGKGRGRGRKRRGAQIEDSEDEMEGGGGGEQHANEVAVEMVAEGPAPQAPGAKGGNTKAGGKGPKVDKGKGADAKRAKTAAAAVTAKVQAATAAMEGADSGYEDEGAQREKLVADALNAVAAAVQEPPTALSHQETQLNAGRGVGGPGSARGRRTLRTYIDDGGEEVTEEVWEDGPAPLQQQQQPSTPPAAQTAAAVVGGHAVAAKMAVKAPAAGGKMTKGKAPAAGQKSMTSFFSKK